MRWGDGGYKGMRVTGSPGNTAFLSVKMVFYFYFSFLN